MQVKLCCLSFHTKDKSHIPVGVEESTGDLGMKQSSNCKTCKIQGMPYMSQALASLKCCVSPEELWRYMEGLVIRDNRMDAVDLVG